MLAPVTSNDNGAGATTSALLFQARSRTTYHWAVDGAPGAAGHVALQCGLDTAARAGLSASISSASTAAAGPTLVFVLTERNAGPHAASRAS